MFCNFKKGVPAEDSIFPPGTPFSIFISGFDGPLFLNISAAFHTDHMKLISIFLSYSYRVSSSVEFSCILSISTLICCMVSSTCAISSAHSFSRAITLSAFFTFFLYLI